MIFSIVHLSAPFQPQPFQPQSYSYSATVLFSHQQTITPGISIGNGIIVGGYKQLALEGSVQHHSNWEFAVQTLTLFIINLLDLFNLFSPLFNFSMLSPLFKSRFCPLDGQPTRSTKRYMFERRLDGPKGNIWALAASGNGEILACGG